MSKEKDIAAKALMTMSNRALAIGRTVLANDRTFLSFIRTSIGLLGGGVGLISYIDHPFFIGAGWFLVFLSLFIFCWGFIRYREMKILLKAFGEKTSESDKDEP